MTLRAEIAALNGSDGQSATTVYRVIGLEMQRREILKRVSTYQDQGRPVPHRLMVELADVTRQCLAAKPRVVIEAGRA